MDDYIHTEITADFIRKAFSECEHIMFYDLETTGLDPHECRIIEFSAVKFDICKPASVSEPRPGIDRLGRSLTPGSFLPQEIRAAAATGSIRSRRARKTEDLRLPRTF